VKRRRFVSTNREIEPGEAEFLATLLPSGLRKKRGTLLGKLRKKKGKKRKKTQGRYAKVKKSREFAKVKSHYKTKSRPERRGGAKEE